jgi:hypothetical protein
MTMTMTVLDPPPRTADPGRVDDAGAERPDPEVPERARRRTFTAKYKLEVLAAYDAAPDGEKARCCGGKACTPVTSWTGAALVTPALWPG